MSSNNYNNHFTFDFVHSSDAGSLFFSSPAAAPPSPPPESKCSSFHLLSLRRRTRDNRPRFGYWNRDQHPVTVATRENRTPFLLVSADRCACMWRRLYLQAADRSRDSGFRLVVQHFRCRRPTSWKKKEQRCDSVSMFSYFFHCDCFIFTSHFGETRPSRHSPTFLSN